MYVLKLCIYVFGSWVCCRGICWFLIEFCLSVKIIKLDIEVEELFNDSKSLLLVCLVGKKFYFLLFDIYREVLVDDLNVNFVDRYNFKERYRR